MLERIQKADLESALAVTSTSDRCPIPSVTTFVSYGCFKIVSQYTPSGTKMLTISTKSFAITVMVCPSIENLWMPSDPALINLNLCVLPAVNWNFDTPALLVHLAVSPSATVVQSKFILPLIRLLSEDGCGLPPGPITLCKISAYGSWYQSERNTGPMSMS